MRLPEFLKMVRIRTGRDYDQDDFCVHAHRILGPGPGTGHDRDYTEGDVERMVAWLHMNDLGGIVSSGSIAAAIRRMALDLIPDDRELGSIVLSQGVATWGFPTVADVGAGMMAIWVWD